MNKIARILIPKKYRIKIGVISTKIRARIMNYDPKKCMNMRYKAVFNKDINWENPTDLIEKINWLQLNTDTSLWTKCADKYKVREYLEEKGCGSYLNELYGKWNNAEDIDLDCLPNSFVIKTNHGCGGVIIIKNKSNLDINKLRSTLNKWLKEKYGLDSGQTHYTRIKPLIIAEKRLIDNDDENVSLIDYKLWCFNGKPDFFLICYNRTKKNYSLSAFDTNWNNISDKALNQNSPHYGGDKISKPQCLNEIIQIASTLSEGIPQVRIDFYVVNNKPIFGEMTFTSGFGSYNNTFYKKLGDLIIY